VTYEHIRSEWILQAFRDIPTSFDDMCYAVKAFDNTLRADQARFSVAVYNLKRVVFSEIKRVFNS
jgi:hypothetical protein